MNRRELIALLAGAAAAPGAARAQQRPRKIPRLGIVDDGAIWKPFRDALRDAGYVDGQTIAFETRVADGDPERLTAAAAELARSGADLDAVVCLHGDLTTTMPAKKGDIKAAVFVMHGSKDPVAPKADRDALEAELDGAGANWQMLDFGLRVHSFAEPETNMPGMAEYNAGAAHQTFRMLDDFIQDAFNKKL